MRRKTLILVAALTMFQPALAAAGDAPGRPAFTAAEMEAIKHDANLFSLIDSDPWAVRHYLDATAAAERATPETNGERTSPEAIWDLFKIMKEAGGQPRPEPPRKAEGE